MTVQEVGRTGAEGTRSRVVFVVELGSPCMKKMKTSCTRRIVVGQCCMLGEHSMEWEAGAGTERILVVKGKETVAERIDAFVVVTVVVDKVCVGYVSAAATRLFDLDDEKAVVDVSCSLAPVS